MTGLLTADEAAGLWAVLVGCWIADALDPLPVPGRDFGIVIDCVEVAP